MPGQSGLDRRRDIVKHALWIGLAAYSSVASAQSVFEIRYQVPGMTPSIEELVSCKAILDAGQSTGDGRYTINPAGQAPIEAYCDMTTDGGGWTRVGYNQDLPMVNRFASGDAYRWVPFDFSYENGYLEFDDATVDAIRAVSNEARQDYVATCQGVVHYGYSSGYSYAAGFRFHDGSTTNYGGSVYNTDISVPADGCYRNDGTARETLFRINDLRLPVINIMTRDSGNPSERYGSKLATNPAWFC